MNDNMKLWLLRPMDGLKKGDNPWEPWYDKAFGFVVRAETEVDARRFAHANAGDENRDIFLNKKTYDTHSPWLDTKYSTCTELMYEGEAGVIIQDFAAA